jgi:hypothetical protein
MRSADMRDESAPAVPDGGGGAGPVGEVMAMRRTLTAGALACSVLVLGLAGARAPQGLRARPGPRDDSEQQRKDLSRVMAKKLKHSQELIAALAVEDFDRLADNARSLKAIGEETLSRVSPNLAYVKYSAEFTTLADELARRAKEGNLNGATLSYVRLTINCGECHKFTRDERILDRRGQEGR